MPRDLIVVTGFGPFRGHYDVNPSWEAVKVLPDELKFAGKVFEIRKIEVPVEYSAVEDVVPKIFSLDPMLVIHCGVNGKINRINLETNAQNGNFCDPDYSSECLSCTTTTLKNNGATCTGLETQLNVDRIIQELTENDSGTLFARSDDVGTYLCCFIYLKSLDICTERTLFIHVPPIDSQFTPDCTSRCIEQVIIKCLEQRCASSGKD